MRMRVGSRYSLGAARVNDRLAEDDLMIAARVEVAQAGGEPVAGRAIEAPRPGIAGPDEVSM